ncbi:MAG: hypothetical protein IKI37_01705 [Oscillospiraceae bacterium]|nr:hypothetical protein [Oscillospiraceae bacterium]
MLSSKMNSNYIKARWYLYCFIAFFGVLCLIITYGALIASKKSGKHYSGVPLFGGFFLFVAGLVSPCKWLCLLFLSDYGYWELLYSFYLYYIKKDKHDD